MGVFKEIVTEQETTVWREIDSLRQQYLHEQFVPDEYSFTLPSFGDLPTKPQTRLREETSSSLIRFLRTE